MYQVCFVCLGNICRSPLAEGVFQSLVAREGLSQRIQISSAGVGHWHIGEPPDRRMQKTALEKGIRLTGQARQFQPSEFSQHNLILAMDQSNLSALQQICPGESRQREKLRLFRSFDPESNGNLDVPDPYYGGDRGFDLVFDIVRRTCPQILNHIKSDPSFSA